jgi:hypothetical protein
MSRSKADQRYVGIDKEIDGGMTDTAKIIRDAWVFGIIPETETCEGWMPQGIADLWQKVNMEWEKYGFLVSRLPDDMRERFMRIQADAFEKAKAAGWNPEMGDDD